MTIHKYGDQYSGTGKQLAVHDSAEGTDSEVVARRELASISGLSKAEAGRHSIDLWFREEVKTLNYRPPVGWRILQTSFFNEGKKNPSMYVEIVREGHFNRRQTNVQGDNLAELKREKGDYR